MSSLPSVVASFRTLARSGAFRTADAPRFELVSFPLRLLGGFLAKYRLNIRGAVDHVGGGFVGKIKERAGHKCQGHAHTHHRHGGSNESRSDSAQGLWDSIGAYGFLDT